MKSAILLFGHGARNPEWQQPFESVSARLRCISPDLLVASAYLEFIKPDLGEAVATLAAAGAEKISIVPLFVAFGMHLKRDLPQLVETMRRRYPAVHFDVLPALGESEEMLKAMTQWILSAADTASHAQ